MALHEAQRWADVEGSDSECDEAHLQLRDECNVQALNADAPEFVPTLTMVCPLVGVICTIAEGTTSEGQGEHPFMMPGVSVRGTATHAGSESSACSPQDSMSRTKSRRARKWKETPQLYQARAEEEWQRRIAQRTKMLQIRQSRLAAYNLDQVTCRKTFAGAPDPTDRTMSSREYHRALDTWFMEAISQSTDETHSITTSTEDGFSLVTASEDSLRSSSTSFDGASECSDR